MRISDWSSDVCSSDLVRVRERKHHVTRRDLAHEVIERVATPIPVALGRPQIPARHLVAVRLVLVDPPVAHGGMQPGLSLFAQGRERAVSLKNSTHANWLSAALPLTQHNQVTDDRLPSPPNPPGHPLVHPQNHKT